jgi:hypothetical protein
MTMRREWPREHPRLGRHLIWIKEVEVAERRRQIRAARRAENARRTRVGQELSKAAVLQASIEADDFHRWPGDDSNCAWVDHLFVTRARVRFARGLLLKIRRANRFELRGAAVNHWKMELQKDRDAMLALKDASRSRLITLV